MNLKLTQIHLITVACVVLMAVIGLSIATFQMVRVGSGLATPKEINLEKAFSFKIETKEDADYLQGQFDSGAVINHWMTLATLEAYSIEGRHRQANMLLLTRVWLRLLSMAAGIILCTAGSLFILGKLREPDTTASAESESGGVKMSFASASPGIVFALLGFLLIIAPLLSNPPVDLKDSRAFMGNENEFIPGVSQ